jgi:hypothetical protein
VECAITLTEILKNKNFTKLLIGQIVSVLGGRLHHNMAPLGLIIKKECRRRIIENCAGLRIKKFLALTVHQVVFYMP